MGEHGVSCLIFFFLKKKHEKSIILPIVFIVLFLNFLKNFWFFFYVFQNENGKKKVGSFDYFFLPQAQHITKNRKNQHLFLRFRFEKRRKRTKNFSKNSKKNNKKSEEPWIFRVLFLKKKKKEKKLYNSFKCPFQDKNLKISIPSFLLSLSVTPQK